MSSSLTPGARFADAAQFGTKTANLQRMSKLATVPSFVGLAHQTIYEHLRQHTDGAFDAAQADLQKALAGATRLSAAAKSQLRNVRQMILDVFDEYPLKIDLRAFANETLMVRSTGREDGTKLTNAGGHTSVAYVPATPAAVAKAMGEVVASYFSERAFQQRLLARDDVTAPPLRASSSAR